MLSDPALEIVTNACLDVGANTAEIFHQSEALIALHAPSLLPQARAIFENGARTCFFECFSAFWLCGSKVSKSVKLRLSAAKLSSAIAISNLDHYVDCNVSNIPYLQGLKFTSGCWDREVRVHYPSAKLWCPLISGWILPNHGIEAVSRHELIPLLKNPFYPSVFITYLSDDKTARSIGELFTSALGILDDAADLAEDFLGGNPNFGVAKLHGAVVPSNEAFNHFKVEVLIHEIPNRMVDLARQQLKECLMLGANESLALFCTCIEAILDSLENYAELCVARLIVNQPEINKN